MRSAISVLFLTLLSVTAQAAAPAFEIASVKAGASGPERIEVGPGSVTMHNVRLPGCIRWAYSVREDQVSGPPWMPDVWFEITGKAAGPATPDELRTMMQTLLAERFKLTLHRQTKELSALVMTVSKSGHKMKAVEAEGSPSFKTGNLNLTGTGATLSQLTEFLSREIRFPVIDQTGLKGRFDYFLDIGSYVTEEMRKEGGNGPPPDAPTIVAMAMQAQLGLKLDSKKASVEMLIVDTLEKTPTEN
ncbi:MAG: TIGR03435 family protein [Candidatus Solibacter sp.]